MNKKTVLAVCVSVMTISLSLWIYGGMKPEQRKSHRRQIIEHVFSTDKHRNLLLETLEPPSKLRILYNRVPKCGSSAVEAVLRSLSTRNSFNLFTSPMVSKPHLAEQSSRKEMAYFISHLNTPVVVSRHLHFINFHTLTEEWPIYINMIRDPLERTMSLYYFLRFGFMDGKPRPAASHLTKQQMDMSFDECVALKDGGCINEDVTLTLRYLCGHEANCTDSKAALALAKWNVEQHYSVVGIHEDMVGFFQVLGKLYPSLFDHAAEIYINESSAIYAEKGTSKKIPPSAQTVKVMRVHLDAEYELYHFVKQRFENQKRQLNITPFPSVTPYASASPAVNSSKYNFPDS